MTKLTKDTYTLLLFRLMDLADETGITLNIASGNCGSFAIALHNIFKEGNFVAFAHWYDPDITYPTGKTGGWGFGHVMVSINKKLYDGLGIHSLKEAKSDWGDGGYYELKTEKDIDIEKEIPEATRYLIPHKRFEKMLRKIGHELGLL